VAPGNPVPSDTASGGAAAAGPQPGAAPPRAPPAAAPATADAGAAPAQATAASAAAPVAAAAATQPAPGASAAEKRFAGARAHALELEAHERWEDAERAYDALLRQDRNLEFAQQGKERAEARIDLGDALQDTLDRPDRILNSQQVRDRAAALLEQARAIPDPGPILASQIERLTGLLPNTGKPLHVALVSDSETQVEIPGVGSFGSFSRRDIELRPGHYTVIGTREGYRDVRRDFVVSPERENETISVRCSERI